MAENKNIVNLITWNKLKSLAKTMRLREYFHLESNLFAIKPGTIFLAFSFSWSTFIKNKKYYASVDNAREIKKLIYLKNGELKIISINYSSPTKRKD